MDADGPQQRLLQAAAGRQEADAQHGEREGGIAGRLGRFAAPKPAQLALICGIILISSFTCSAMFWMGSQPALMFPAADAAGSSNLPASDARRVMQLRYSSFHPFNLILRMSMQTVFGMPGETACRIPMLYSNFELEVVLRTLNSSASGNGSNGGINLSKLSLLEHSQGQEQQQGDRTGPCSWLSYAAAEPSSAFMYGAALLTLPRATLLYGWMHDHDGGYAAVLNTRVDVLDAADKLLMGGLRAGIRSIGLLAATPAAAAPTAADAATAADAEPTVSSSEEEGAAAANSAGRVGSGLGLWFWPLATLFPSAVTCYLALALVESSPFIAGWVVLASLFRGACELRVLLHAARFIWRRRPQAAVQCLACSHGVPFMLGCHALLLLRLAAALLPARAFLVLSFHMYGTWAPLVAAAIMLLALQPNNGQLLEGAMDNFLHLGQGHGAGAGAHRAAHDDGTAAAAAAAAAGGGVTASVSVRRRQHWPPPVCVPAEMQESAEMAPKHLLCPITHHILTEPAVTSTGATYERSAIVEWLAKAGKDPLTGHIVSAEEVFPNLAMYTVVEEYVREATAKAAATDSSGPGVADAAGVKGAQ